MREIKFRAWSNQLNKMTYPDEKGWFNICFLGSNNLTQHCQLGSLLEMNGKEVEVMQYTGLKDKNEKEIYEGDICKTDLSRPYLIVEFRNGYFMYQCHDEGQNYYDCMVHSDFVGDKDKYAEVIGNIYENPQLLGEDKL